MTIPTNEDAPATPRLDLADLGVRMHPTAMRLVLLLGVLSWAAVSLVLFGPDGAWPDQLRLAGGAGLMFVSGVFFATRLVIWTGPRDPAPAGSVAPHSPPR